MTQIVETLQHLAVPITQLKHYDGNARISDLDVIKESLTAHGQYRPVVVRSGSNEILAGNHLVMAARELEWDQVAVTYVQVTDEQAAKIVLVDNRTSDLSSYDDELLIDLLQSVKDDLTGTGFNQNDIDKLLNELDGDSDAEVEYGDADIEETPERFGVIIECKNYSEQEELLDRLIDEGLNVKAVM